MTEPSSASGGSSLCFPALGLKPVSSPITTTHKASLCPPSCLVLPTHTPALAAVDHLEGNGPASTKRPCSKQSVSQSVSDHHQPVELLPPPPSFAPPPSPSPRRPPAHTLRPQARHSPSTRTRKSTLPSDPALNPTFGSHLPHANLVCRRDTSSCVSRFSIQQVPAQLESTAANRPARGCCCAVLCCVLCRNPHEVPALRAAAQEKTPAAGGVKVCVVSNTARPGDAATPAS